MTIKVHSLNIKDFSFKVFVCIHNLKKKKSINHIKTL